MYEVLGSMPGTENKNKNSIGGERQEGRREGERKREWGEEGRKERRKKRGIHTYIMALTEKQ
jgi:hypothetical protein